MPGALRRALHRPARTLLKFEPVPSTDRGSVDRRRVRGQVGGQVRVWSAADHNDGKPLPPVHGVDDLSTRRFRNSNHIGRHSGGAAKRRARNL
jgi:hypothetical protein